MTTLYIMVDSSLASSGQRTLTVNLMRHTYTYIAALKKVICSCYNQVRMEYSEPLSDEVRRTAAALFESNYGPGSICGRRERMADEWFLQVHGQKVAL